MRNCACGCRRRVKGRYVSGHNLKHLKKTAAHRSAIAEGQRQAWRTKRERLPVGSTNRNAQGYVLVKMTAGAGRWVLQHAIVAATILGRPLRKGEVVHHIDGDRANNSPSNLCVCRSRSHHNDVHASQDQALRVMLRAGLVRFKGGRYEAVLRT